MKIFDDVEIVGKLPAVYFKNIDALAISDLHLGYEGIAAESGVFLPKVQFREEMLNLKKLVKMRSASTIIINGDVKHEFSRTSHHEFREVSDVLKFLKERFERVFLIKGNHDNYIHNVASRIGVEVKDELNLNGYLFTHGHKDLSLERVKASVITIGHEHPAVALYDDVGGKEVVKCLLFGKVRGKRILVMPAFSTLSYGTEINLVPKEELLSPLLRKINVNELEAVGIDEEAGVLKFGKVGRLRRV